MPYNVPDDWNSYYYSCGCHASEGGCSCPISVEDSERPWLEDSGYDWDGEECEWSKLISSKVRTCRKDHKDGRVLKGQRYRVQVYRYINDESGECVHETRKMVLSPRS